MIAHKELKGRFENVFVINISFENGTKIDLLEEHSDETASQAMPLRLEKHKDQVVLKIAKNVQPKDLTAIIAIDGMRSAAICNQRAFLPISPLSPPKRQGMPVFVDNNLIDILVSDMVGH
ncbi:3101_t:CDS:2 [Entrophospora sp. SA101]|nr:3101_t:CDS:2 [Entrophospora sp. SA101]